jgi:hypothetical protein
MNPKYPPQWVRVAEKDGSNPLVSLVFYEEPGALQAASLKVIADALKEIAAAIRKP